jgi:hypothetical protein
VSKLLNQQLRLIILSPPQAVSVEWDGAENSGRRVDESPGFADQEGRQSRCQLRMVFIFELMNGPSNWPLMQKGREGS